MDRARWESYYMGRHEVIETEMRSVIDDDEDVV